jgi:hypothetical protein
MNVEDVMFVLYALAAGLCFAPAIAQAAPFVIDFEDLGLSSGQDLLDSTLSTTAYGVSSTQRSGFGDSSVNRAPLRFWTGGYSDLSNVAWGGASNASGEVPTFAISASDPSQEVELHGFTLGSWQSTSRTSEWWVYDLGWNLLEQGTANVAANGVAIDFAGLDVQGAGGVIIQWENGWGVAIDDIGFNVVPIPAALPLLGTALAGLAWMRRRRVAG